MTPFLASFPHRGEEDFAGRSLLWHWVISSLRRFFARGWCGAYL